MPRRTSSSLRTRYRVVERTLVIDLGAPMRVLSSAPRGGGLRSTRYILNHQVESKPVSTHLVASTDRARIAEHGSPSRSLRQIASALGMDEHCVGLMTAVPMTQLVTSREETRGLWVECFATVGVTNAVRAGEPCQCEPVHAVHKAGTINLIVITNACLSPSAMVGAIQVATESKTGILRDYAIPSWTGQPGATGTGTDAVVIVCACRGEGVFLPYSGTHTEIGAMIGRVVGDCVSKGLARAEDWTARASDRSRSVPDTKHNGRTFSR